MPTVLVPTPMPGPMPIPAPMPIPIPIPFPVPMPTAGDIERTGMLGGGPGSAPGDRRCIERNAPDPFILVSSPVRRTSSDALA